MTIIEALILKVQEASVAQICTDILAVLALFGIGIEFTPFIKLNPVSWLCTKLGRAFNKETLHKVDELSRKVDELDKKQTQKQVDDLRWNILNFANSCRNHVKHTREEFTHVIKAHTDYLKILSANHLENGQVDADYKYIMEIYNECMHNDTFL